MLIVTLLEIAAQGIWFLLPNTIESLFAYYSILRRVLPESPFLEFDLLSVGLYHQSDIRVQ